MFDKNYITRLFSISPEIHDIFIKANSSSEARLELGKYLDLFLDKLYKVETTPRTLEWSLRANCTQAFREMISERSKEKSNFNLVQLLWILAHGRDHEYPVDLSDGFFEELIHLWQGIINGGTIYKGKSTPKFINMQGREAAIERSQELDKFAAQTLKHIKRYASGLDENIIELRKQNKAHIIEYFGATDTEWDDYLWQIRHVIRDRKTLESLIELTTEEKQAIDLAKEHRIPFGVTPYYVSLMDPEPSRKRDHAIRAQVIPPLHYVRTMLSHRQDRSYCFDFMNEQDTSPIDLITRRYPHIVILKPYNTCSQICVYCQRNWEIDDVLDTHALATRDKIQKAIDWIREHAAITEVLITGGDPLVMNDERLDFVLSEVASIDHVERIRIGSRTPVVLPQRMTDSLIECISKYYKPGTREVILVTHFEHAYEITPQAMKAIQKFKQRGISIYNQAVFTVENSRRFELSALRRNLRLIGVDPYYSFNTKGKEETKNYRVPIARLQQEVKEEARLLPGMLRTDEAVYNVPRLGKNYLKAEQHHTLLNILPDGRRVYEFHPWEKFRSPVETYIDVDVSIYEYLKEIESRGEDISEYESIWYYF